MSKMDKYLQELITMQKDLGRSFIDPFEDLGDFNRRLMDFEEPIENLKNKYTGDPYTEYWQSVIRDMRVVYANYQREVQAMLVPDQEKNQYIKDTGQKEKIRKIVTSLLSLGFSFKDISKRVGYTEKYLRRNYKRSDYNKTSSTIIFLRKDLENGVKRNIKNIPLRHSVERGWSKVM